MPTVSVIMPVFNAQESLSRAIDSILNQTYADFEFLIINDGSTDSSSQLIKNYTDERIAFINNEPNSGSLKSRNELFDLAKGKYIVFQDADDFSVENRIETLVNFMETNPDVYLCGSNATFYNEKGVATFTSSKPETSEEIRKHFRNSIPVLFASSIVRREVLESIGKFKPFFFDLGNYDYDWMYRISEKHRCANIKASLYHVSRKDTSNSLTIVNPYKIIGHKIVQFLASEREKKGFDSLENDLEKVKQFAEEALEPYKNDPSLYLYNRIVGLLSENMYNEALKVAALAIRKNPKKILNYRTYFYVWRKRLTTKSN